MSLPPYEARILRVVDHLWANLDAPLDLDRLAKIACFSPYHFHRLYRGITGETVAETVRRLRLHRAAGQLAQSDQPIADIANRAGYGSQAAFTRSFSADYGTPPGLYRLRTTSPNAMEDKMLPIDFVTLTDLPCVAVAHRGPYMEIGKAFEQVSIYAGTRGLIGPETRMFGVYYDDPNAVPAADLRSEACLTVPPGTDIAAPAHALTIAGGRYVTALHTGPYAELEKAYQWLFGAWLPTSGHEPDDRPSLEEYLNDPRTLPPTEWQTLIYIPLKG
ncbi:GyrI-like domain-containing protein [Elstera sp.]|jgi:AraC family transcriptional regulator|uniref:GyrI-like domain-containing protein n=1 Tax=Elstera sp. TaxID=1916664 RepID=UPI0037BF4D14